MPYKLRKAPNRDLYWVVAIDGKKMSKDPIPKERAEAQMRALYASMRHEVGRGKEDEESKEDEEDDVYPVVEGYFDDYIGSGRVGGGSKFDSFLRTLNLINLPPAIYLDVVKKKAEIYGYNPSTIKFSDDGKHKIEILDPSKKTIRFGHIDYKDHIMWMMKELNDKKLSGIAEKKRRTFLASHSKMKGNWKHNDYSPNILSMRLLW